MGFRMTKIFDLRWPLTFKGQGQTLKSSKSNNWLKLHLIHRSAEKPQILFKKQDCLSRVVMTKSHILNKMKYYNLIFADFHLWRLAITTIDKQSCFLI